MEIFIFAIICPAERDFESVAICKLKISPESNSRTPFFFLLNLEAAVFVAKD